jgi:hypothetical protein
VNNHDRQNIEFIRSLAPDALVQWIDYIRETSDDDEIDYVMEMLTAARDQIEMDLLEFFDAEDDVSEAAEYLQRFRLQ